MNLHLFVVVVALFSGAITAAAYGLRKASRRGLIRGKLLNQPNRSLLASLGIELLGGWFPAMGARGRPYPTASRAAIVRVVALEERVVPSSWGVGLGSFNGVECYSNANAPTVAPPNNTTGIYTGLEWQCVEFVQRYYWLEYDRNLYALAHQQLGTGLNGAGFFVNASALGLAAYQNGGMMSPQVGDILCFGGGPSGLGHVAIVRAVTATDVYVIEQNGVNTVQDADFPLSMAVSGGDYYVSAANLSGKLSPPLYVQGWLRIPAATIQAPSTSWIYSSQSSTNFGQSVTFTVWVYGPNGSTPTGSVNLTDGSHNQLGSANLNYSSPGWAYATFTTWSLTVGSHTITENYLGNNLLRGSSASIGEVINPIQATRPSTAVLIGPSGVVYNNFPAFSWYSAAGATWYQVFAWDAHTGQVMIDTWTQSSWFVAANWFAPGTYGFEIESYGNGVYGDWSPVMYFAVI